LQDYKCTRAIHTPITPHVHERGVKPIDKIVINSIFVIRDSPLKS
jgi:hypothetical protein